MEADCPSPDEKPTTPRADQIAQAVISQFNKLPAKRKPTIRDNGLHEWVPLSGIVAEKDGRFTCVALATGMKCLPASKLAAANGNAIHDSHAEVLALRALNRHLLDECAAIAQHGQGSQVVQVVIAPDDAEQKRTSSRPFRIKDGVKLHMYCSEAPCGDASMELLIAARSNPPPWQPPPAPPDTTAAPHPSTSLPGRAYFSHLGIVRRKPARGDAPPTLSKSCSDKLALKQATSVLSSLTSLLVEPQNGYIESVVLPEARYSGAACRRAFSQRMDALLLSDTTWTGGYRFGRFRVETTTEEFAFSRGAVAARMEPSGSAPAAETGGAVPAPSNIAAVWTASGLGETLLGGVLRGRRPFEERGASGLSRRSMWVAARGLSALVEGGRAERLRRCLGGETYALVKECDLLAERRLVKERVRGTALQGWTPNEGDSNFSIGPGPPSRYYVA